MSMREVYRYDRKAGAVVRKPEPISCVIEPFFASSYSEEMLLLREEMQLQVAEMFANGGKRIARRELARKFT